MAAFRNLTDELSIPHFEDNLHHTAARFPERPSLQSDHGSQMLLKEGRERISQLRDCRLPSAAGRGLDINDLHSRQRCEEAEDAHDVDDDVSLLNREVGSMETGGPTWFSSALLKRHQSGESFVEGGENRKLCGCEPGSHCAQCSFLHLQTQPATSTCNSGIGNNRASSTHWMASPMTTTHEVQLPVRMADAVPSASIMRLSTQQSHGSADNINPSSRPGRGFLDLHSDTAKSRDLVEGETNEYDNRNWRSARLKADILSHPLYEQLLAAHVACLRIATPVEQLPRIDAQLARSHHVLAKYSVLGQNHLLIGEEKDELDQFMTHYVLLLCSFKEQLQHHVRVHAMEAVMACWQLEQSLLNLTGVSPGEGTGATMSDDDDDQEDPVAGSYDTVLDEHDTGGFGPLIPTETERSLMERVRQELKNDLKQGYRNRIVDVREEILRKRRAGKLPGDTTSVLKSWWHAHTKWPYPTEDEKVRLVQETGLQLKQINNWFINQRKRNWHSSPSSSSTLKSKRKRS